MTNTICGHGRDVLIWVLSVHVRERCLMAPCELSETEAQSASDAVHDPAKLAEMLAARGRELGFDARCCDGFGIPKHRGEMTVIWHDDCQVVEVWCHRWHTFTMPTARDVLAAWIRLPEGLTEEAKQVLAQYNQQTRRP